MNTTVTIPDDLARQARDLAHGTSLTELVCRALQERLEQLQTQRLARDLEEGYRAEADEPSLDGEWMAFEI